MKTLMRACLFSALLALPVAASAQTDTPKADAPKAAGGMMMSCPMMADMGGMQKSLGTMMSDVESMMKGAKDAGTKERLQKMHDGMAAMMVSMQKMGGMMSNMMSGATMPSGQEPGNAAPATPATPATPPVSPEDHEAHHPGQ